MSLSQNKKMTAEIERQMNALRAECERFDRKGLHDTAHHQTLRRMEKEYGVEPKEKDNGKSDL